MDSYKYTIVCSTWQTLLAQSYLKKPLPLSLFQKIKEICQIMKVYGVGIVYSLDACIVWYFSLNYKLEAILIICESHSLHTLLLAKMYSFFAKLGIIDRCTSQLGKCLYFPKTCHVFMVIVDTLGLLKNVSCLSTWAFPPELPLWSSS